MRLRLNLPPAPVYWLEVQERFDDLVVGTYGRGYYILDNIAPLREFDMDVGQADAHLFSLRPAYRFLEQEAIKTDGPSLNSGRNPSYGADINYFLKDSTDQRVEIQILNGDDELIRTLEGTKEAGINRVMWDLRYEPTYKPKLQTTPPGRPWVQLNGEGWRPLVTWDLDLMRGQYGPRVIPDTYKVKLLVGDREFQREVTVLKDPSSEGTLEDIQAQVAFSLQLRDAINTAVLLINELEGIRSELVEILPKLNNPEDIEMARELQETATSIAGTLYDIHLTGAREDAFRAPMKLYGRLSALASDITGNGADFRPTNQQEEVYGIFNERLEAVRQKFQIFMDEEIKKLNIQLEQSALQIRGDSKIKQ